MIPKTPEYYLVTWDTSLLNLNNKIRQAWCQFFLTASVAN